MTAAAKVSSDAASILSMSRVPYSISRAASSSGRRGLLRIRSSIFDLSIFTHPVFSYIVGLCVLENNGNDGQIKVNIFYLLKYRKKPFFRRFICYDGGVFFVF